MVNVENTFEDVMRDYMKKIQGGILPPDPARLIKGALDLPPKVEHILPIPPLIEYVHDKATVPLIEKLPRLPMTSEFPFEEWLKWKVEKF